MHPIHFRRARGPSLAPVAAALALATDNALGARDTIRL